MGQGQNHKCSSTHSSIKSNKNRSDASGFSADIEDDVLETDGKSRLVKKCIVCGDKENLGGN